MFAPNPLIVVHKIYGRKLLWLEVVFFFTGQSEKILAPSKYNLNTKFNKGYRSQEVAKRSECPRSAGIRHVEEEK